MPPLEDRSVESSSTTPIEWEKTSGSLSEKRCRTSFREREIVDRRARHFLTDAFLTDLETVVALHCRAGLCPVTLELEVTETEALRDLSQAQRMVEKCRELGIVVSLDDFGTGQASLTSLQKLAIGEIKIAQGYAIARPMSAEDIWNGWETGLPLNPGSRKGIKCIGAPIRSRLESCRIRHRAIFWFMIDIGFGNSGRGLGESGTYL